MSRFTACLLLVALVTLAGCAALAKMGMVKVDVDQRVPRPSPGNVAGVEVVWANLPDAVRAQYGDVRYRPSVEGRKMHAWLSDYSANEICFGIEDYPSGNMSLSGTASPYERLDMALVRSDGVKLTGAKRDKLATDLIDLYFANEYGYDQNTDAQYQYATGRACFATKEAFITDSTTSLTWVVGDSHYTFRFSAAG